jgi:two-component system alkaline phosphatase synthesis response regulator PhoP
MSLLLARMRALLRRHRREIEANDGHDAQKTPTINLGKLSVNPNAYEASCDGALLDLSPRLFEILMYLINNPGKVVSRDELLNQVWGYDFAGQTRTVDVHVHWLREQLARYGCDDLVQTIRGVGYKLVPSGDTGR